jgi:chromosome segregation ATPase
MGFLFSKPAGFDYSTITYEPINTLEVKNIPTGDLTRLQQRTYAKQVNAAIAKIEKELEKGHLDNRCAPRPVRGPGERSCTPNERQHYNELHKAEDRMKAQQRSLEKRTITNKNVVHSVLVQNNKELTEVRNNMETKEEKMETKEEKMETKKKEMNTKFEEYIKAKRDISSLDNEKAKLKLDFRKRKIRNNEFKTRQRKIDTKKEELAPQRNRLKKEYEALKIEYNTLKKEYDDEQDKLNAAHVKQNTIPTATTTGGRRKTKRAKRTKVRT